MMEAQLPKTAALRRQTVCDDRERLVCGLYLQHTTRLQRLAAMSWEGKGLRCLPFIYLSSTSQGFLYGDALPACDANTIVPLPGDRHAIDRWSPDSGQPRPPSSQLDNLSSQQKIRLEVHFSHAAAAVYGGLWLSASAVLLPWSVGLDGNTYRVQAVAGVDEDEADQIRLPDWFFVEDLPCLAHRLPRDCHYRLAEATQDWQELETDEFWLRYNAAREGVLMEYPQVRNLKTSSRLGDQVPLLSPHTGKQQSHGYATPNGALLWVKPKHMQARSERGWWGGSAPTHPLDEAVVPSEGSLLNFLWEYHIRGYDEYRSEDSDDKETEDTDSPDLDGETP